MLDYLPKEIRDRRGQVIHRVEPGDTDYNDAQLRFANLRDANLEGAHFAAADLQDADLRRADLYWSELGDTDLTRADLRNAKLQGAGLCGTRFVDAWLQGANFGPDNLGGTTDLSEAVLTGAEYDPTTRFPEGFDPEATGMVRRFRDPNQPRPLDIA
ncbi:MAG: pentapeptide repeat-containing protein [Planctomycetota bacterium]